MKVTAFVGSARKKHTYNATKQFLEKLQSLGNVEYEIVMLSDYKLGTCKGCMQCLNKGEELCPFKDDRDKLMQKIIDSDGIIFATPNYSFQVSGYMKIFLDRIAFCFHRPRFFGKTCTNIVAQGIYGGRNIVKYLDFIAGGLGFNVVKGLCITTREPISEKRQEKIDKLIDRQSMKFYKELVKKEYPTPTFFKLIMFRVSRTMMRLMLDKGSTDYVYYKKKGWFRSDYYYPTRLNPIKKAVGKLSDIAANLTK